jgi:hypothetical protein
MSDLSLTFDDWDELLGLGGVLDGLAEGRYGPAEARDRLARREVYPGIGLDYVRAINAFEDVVVQIEAAIASQNRALDRFNSSTEEIGETFRYDRERLLTAAERAAFEEVRRRVELEAAVLAAEAQQREWEIEELELQLEDLQQQLEDVGREIEAVLADIESVQNELDELDDG